MDRQPIPPGSAVDHMLENLHRCRVRSQEALKEGTTQKSVNASRSSNSQRLSPLLVFSAAAATYSVAGN